MNPGSYRGLHNIQLFLFPFLMMVVLFAGSSLPGDSSGIPREAGLFGDTIEYLVRFFSLIPPTVHNALHVPGYLLLAWALYIPLRLWLKPLPCLILTLTIATGYGALLEWNQMNIPGRYPSFGDMVLNISGALLGCLLARRKLRRVS